MAQRGRVRMTVEISPRLLKILDNYAASKGSTRADALRFAVELLEAGKQAQREGFTLGAWANGPDGVHHERVFVGV